jgi:hypothetical protein
MAQVVECLLSKFEALSLAPAPPKKKNQKDFNSRLTKCIQNLNMFTDILESF